MQPHFVINYSEFSVGNELLRRFKGTSLFVPASSQESGIDLILYKRDATLNKVMTIQVKSSRAHSEKKKNGFRYAFWLNTFKPATNADFFIITGQYPKYPENINDTNVRSIVWESIFLLYTYSEMKDLMDSIKLKTRPDEPDTKFAYSFNSCESIYLTRGHKSDTIASEHLLSNRIKMIEDFFG